MGTNQKDRYFANLTGKDVRIAIIDSGIHAAHPHIGGISGGVAFLEDGSQSNDYVDRLGHGTAVAATIREKAPGAELFALKVFDRSLTTRVNVLVDAILWAARNGIPLVNLSLGTTKPEHEDVLRGTIREVRKQGMLIVAAYENDGVHWLPGSLPGVVPVVLDWECPRGEYRVQETMDGNAVFRASGYAREIPGVSPEKNLKGISFAVANMTGFVARALEAHPRTSLQDLLPLLQAQVTPSPDNLR